MLQDTSYLSRSLGMNPQINIDYHSLQVEAGDMFVLATDGADEYADANVMSAAISDNPSNLDQAARQIVNKALRRGSQDNLTVQLVGIEEVPSPDAAYSIRRLSSLLPPLL